MMRFFSLAVVLLMMLTSVAVAGQGESPMVGKWVAVSYMGHDVPEGTLWLENRADGTGTVYQGDEESNYTWYHDEESGTCTVGTHDDEATYNIAIVGDTCTSTDIQTGAVVMVMKRVTE